MTKLARLAAGEPPRVLDLFSGCGGLSLGFQAAGFAISGAVELDPPAAASHGLNFHSGGDDALRRAHQVARDITDLTPAQLCEELQLGPAERAFDVVVGGPPCQAFARVGRSKLREIAEHPQAFRHDGRARLYLRYLEYVKVLKPLALVMENVPDVLNHGGQNIAEETCEVLEDLGYVCGYTLLNAAFYGVPQMRERMFLIAYARGLAEGVTFPQPTHWIDLPDGYAGSRQVALKHLSRGLLMMRRSAYQEPPQPTPDLPRAVSAREALDDLPPITLHLEGKLRRGARRFEDLIRYDPTRPVSAYGQLMRNWPGFESTVGIRDHVIRWLPRDYAIFRRMAPGDQYPQALERAEALFRERLAGLRATGRPASEGSPEYEELHARTVPPYDVGKFPNKWRKMEADLPARTLMAHLGKDSYSHIHYDSAQARTISVREAARLQSFPDGFTFVGTMNPAFRQIGNAVPPLLAEALAKTIRAAIDRVVAEHRQSRRGRHGLEAQARATGLGHRLPARGESARCPVEPSLVFGCGNRDVAFDDALSPEG